MRSKTIKKNHKNYNRFSPFGKDEINGVAFQFHTFTSNIYPGLQKHSRGEGPGYSERYCVRYLHIFHICLHIFNTCCGGYIVYYYDTISFLLLSTAFQ